MLGCLLLRPRSTVGRRFNGCHRPVPSLVKERQSFCKPHPDGWIWYDPGQLPRRRFRIDEHPDPDGTREGDKGAWVRNEQIPSRRTDCALVAVCS